MASLHRALSDMTVHTFTQTQPVISLATHVPPDDSYITSRALAWSFCKDKGHPVTCHDRNGREVEVESS